MSQVPSDADHGASAPLPSESTDESKPSQDQPPEPDKQDSTPPADKQDSSESTDESKPSQDQPPEPDKQDSTPPADKQDSSESTDESKPSQDQPPEPDKQDSTKPSDQQNAKVESKQTKDLPKPRSREKKVEKGPSALVRYGLMRNVGQFRHKLDSEFRPGTKVVIRTNRGVELGEIIAGVSHKTCYGCVSRKDLADFLECNGPEYPFSQDGKILRLANPQDEIDQRHLDVSAEQETAFCREQIAKLKLDMKIVHVEHLLGGERIIFYFAAENRVDFRELVRTLAGEYRTRIDMRQVGARDEARLVADYERCGQRCCCQQFIKNLKPISMRMAKVQKATLDPSKISGRCGRLMCCLKFEDSNYEQLKRLLPHKNIWVETENLIGRVVNTQILTQLVKLELSDRTYTFVANEEIIKRNVDPPEPGKPAALRKPRPAPKQPIRKTGKRLADAAHDETSPEPPKAATEQSAEEPRKKKRRRRRRKKPSDQTTGQESVQTSAQASSPQPQAEGASGAERKPDSNRTGGDGEAEGQPKRKRRRRRRRKKPAAE